MEAEELARLLKKFEVTCSKQPDSPPELYVDFESSKSLRAGGIGSDPVNLNRQAGALQTFSEFFGPLTADNLTLLERAQIISACVELIHKFMDKGAVVYVALEIAEINLSKAEALEKSARK